MLRKLLVVVVVLLAIIAVVPVFLPSGFAAQASATIHAPRARIYETVATLRTWPEWTVWNAAADPKATWSHSGPDAGQGAVMTWSGERLGEGRLEIVAADPETGLAYTMHMSGMAPVHGEIRFAPAAAGATEVTWRDRGELGYALRVLRPMFERMLADAFTRNLAGLESRLAAK